MGIAEVKKMRKTQFMVTNVLLVLTIIVIFLLIQLIDITFSQFFLTLSVILLVQAVIGFVKGESTKSWIPIFEQVARYEKQKLGSEWKKQKRTDNIWKLILSGLLLIQFYLSLGATNPSFQLDWSFVIFTTFVLFVFMNISLFIHTSKVDRSTTDSDLKGYTWKSNLIGVFMGVMLGVVIIMAVIIYVLSGI